LTHSHAKGEAHQEECYSHSDRHSGRHGLPIGFIQDERWTVATVLSRFEIKVEFHADDGDDVGEESNDVQEH